MYGPSTQGRPLPVRGSGTALPGSDGAGSMVNVVANAMATPRAQPPATSRHSWATTKVTPKPMATGSRDATVVHLTLLVSIQMV